jgi:hypothetical protein
LRNAFEDPKVLLEVKLQAGFKMGRCLERLGQAEEAFEQYAEIVYTYLTSGEGPNSPAGLWFTQSAFAAAEIREGQEKWREAVRLYRRVVHAGVPRAEEANGKIQRIRREQWFLF